MESVVDSLGLVRENNFLVTYFPAVNRALVFRVKSRVNRGYEEIDYGFLPIPKDTSLPTYLGTTVTVPADGVLPGFAYLPAGISFPAPTGISVVEATDMWYLSEDYRERVFHVIQRVTPGWLRVDLMIPTGVTQRTFMRDKSMVGITSWFGYNRGALETVHFPKLHYGYRYGNDTNLNVYTFVKFTYGEYIVETPRDPELIFNILTRRVPSKWITMPVNVWDSTIRAALRDVYGFEGFTVYGVHKKEKALEKYEALLGEVKV